MRICKHGCDVTMSVSPGTIRKHFRSFRKTRKVILSTTVKEMEKNFPNFDRGLPISSPLISKGKKSKIKMNYSVLSTSPDDLIDGNEAKTIKYATKYAVNVFQSIFCI